MSDFCVREGGYAIFPKPIEHEDGWEAAVTIYQDGLRYETKWGDRSPTEEEAREQSLVGARAAIRLAFYAPHELQKH